MKMNTTQRILDLAPKTKLRLSEIERLIRVHRIVVPPLSRRTLIGMCEDGTLRSAARTNARSQWLVYEDSFIEWVRSLDREQ